MEFAIKVLVVAMLALIAVMVMALLIFGWGGNVSELFQNFVKWVESLMGGGNVTLPIP